MDVRKMLCCVVGCVRWVPAACGNCAIRFVLGVELQTAPHAAGDGFPPGAGLISMAAHA